MPVNAECPVCLKTLKPPIKSCTNGHAVCGDCQGKVKTCPTCRCDLIFRNTALEKILEEIPLACKHAGCGEMRKGAELTSHQDLCFYRSITCYTNACPIPYGTKFPLNSFVEHLEKNHQKQINLMNSTSDGICTPWKNSYTVKPQETAIVNLLQLSHSKEFFVNRFNLNLNTKEFFVYVRYVGKNENADKYMYTVTVDQDMGECDKFCYTNFCMPYHASSEKVQIPRRRLHTNDYRGFFRKDLTEGDKIEITLKIFPATKSPVK